MAPKAGRYTADDFELEYGDMVRAQYHGCGTAHQLGKALERHKPPISMSPGLLKQWFVKHGMSGSSRSSGSSGITIKSRLDLQQQFGDILPSMADTHTTPYLLCKALAQLSPPVILTQGIARECFKHNRSELKYIKSAGDLEVHCGGRIRESGAQSKDAEGLREWLRIEQKVDASTVVCKTWLRPTVWSSDGALRSVYDIEEKSGGLLRLQMYADSFSSDASADVLAEQLTEGQPPVSTTGALLRQWYTKYHPGAGVKRIASVEELEAFMGEELRVKYQGIGERLLPTVLGRRRCPVLVSRKVARGWQEKYGIRVLKRPAAAVSGNSAPASKRRRTNVSAASSEPAAPALTAIRTVLELEYACGERYRKEYTDLGLGMQGRGDMPRILASWGYAAKDFVCRRWLRQYRLDGACKHGNAGVFELSRTDLRRWS